MNEKQCKRIRRTVKNFPVGEQAEDLKTGQIFWVKGSRRRAYQDFKRMAAAARHAPA